jgi:hypothetical protein
VVRTGTPRFEEVVFNSEDSCYGDTSSINTGCGSIHGLSYRIKELIHPPVTKRKVALQATFLLPHKILYTQKCFIYRDIGRGGLKPATKRWIHSVLVLFLSFTISIHQATVVL